MIREIPPGSVLYCKLGPFEHSGVYIGDNQIIELSGQGRIQTTNPRGFLSGCPGTSRIFVACDEYGPLCKQSIIARAKHKAGHSRSYNMVLDNCHQFTAGCITGQFENNHNFFYILESVISTHLNNNLPFQWKRCDSALDTSAAAWYDCAKIYDASQWLPSPPPIYQPSYSNKNSESLHTLDFKEGWVKLIPPKDYGAVELELAWWFVKCGDFIHKGQHLLNMSLSDLEIPIYSPISGYLRDTSSDIVFSPDTAFAVIEPA